MAPVCDRDVGGWVCEGYSPSGTACTSGSACAYSGQCDGTGSCVQTDHPTRLVSGGLPQSSTAGTAYSVSAAGQYCASGTWQNDPSYAAAVTLTSSDPALAPQAYQYTAGDGGSHVFSYVPKTAGGQTITTSDNAGHPSVSQGTTVQPGPLHHITIDQPMKSPVTTGDTVTVCFQPNGAAVETHGNWIGAVLHDFYDNPTTSAHTFRIATGDPQATAPDLTTATSTLRWGQCASPPFSDGVTFQNAGTYTVGVVDLADPSISTSNPESVVVDAPQLQVSILGSGTGSVTSSPAGINCPSGPCSMSASAGSTVVLSAQASPGSAFRGWGGACSGTGGCSMTMSSDQSVSATFDLETISACGRVQCGGGVVPPGSWRSYADTSPFNLPINLATAQTLPNSSQIIGRILGDIAATKQPSNLLIANDGSTGWPTYWGRVNDPGLAPDDPADSIGCGGTVNGVTYGPDCDVSAMSVHAPAGAAVQGAEPTADADRHMTIIDQGTGNEFDLWRVSESPLAATPHVIPTIWSGFSSITGTGLALSVKGEGNAGRFGNLAGRIRFEELSDAISAGSSLRHALTIVVNCTTSTTIFPAGSNTGTQCANVVNAPPMGARIHLKLTVAQIDALNLPAWKKVLLRTMSVYGAIINDTGSNNYFDWQYESGNQYTSVGGSDPWLPWAHALSDQQTAGTQITDFFPWDDSASPDCSPRCVGVNCTPHCIGFKGLWNQPEDAAANVWTSANLEVMARCVSDGSC